MGKNSARLEYRRLKSLLMQDKANVPCQLGEVLKSDVYFSFKNYMELKPENIKIYFDADEKGYHVIVSARTNRFKQVGMLPRAGDTKLL
jgi:septum formation topological specificity factor MinE